MDKKVQWQNATKGLYQAILINVFASIAVAVFGFFATINEVSDTITAVARDGQVSPGWGTWDYLELIANLGVIAAVVLFFLRLGDWKALLIGNDEKAVGQIRLAMILSLVATVLGFIPGIGILALLVSLAALILQLLGYSALKNSTTLPAKASEGAGKVFTSQILAIVAAIVVFIPIIGGIAALVCSIIGFIMMLKGWNLIANSAE